MIILPNNEGVFEITGTLKYNPKRDKLKKTRTHDDFFLILDLPKDVGVYYRYWVKKRFDLFLNPPAYGEHITILDGRVPVTQDKQIYWNKYKDKKIKIHYSNHLYQKWKFWCLPAQSEQLNDIREELGFTRLDFFHITFGRMN